MTEIQIDHARTKARPTGTSRINRRSAIRMSVAMAATLATSGGAIVARANSETKSESEPSIAPLQTQFVLEALLTVASAVEVGPSSRGIRRYIPITGGQFHGSEIKGVVLPGGADWQLERPDGVLEVDALYSIKAEDGAVIVVHNRGVLTKWWILFQNGSAIRGTQGAA